MVPAGGSRRPPPTGTPQVGGLRWVSPSVAGGARTSSDRPGRGGPMISVVVVKCWGEER